VAKRFYDWVLSAETQKAIFTDLNVFSTPSSKAATLHPKAPRLSDIKVIAYDNAKYGSSAERVRLLKKWDAEVKSQRK
jgi:iron(III) transport system substrate-binding protein